MTLRDLPPIWHDATPIAVKMHASGASVGREVSPLATTGRVKTLLVLLVRDALYRHDQTVEGFVARTTNGLLVLIQPTNMKPYVGMEKCRYNLAMVLPVIAAKSIRDDERVLQVLLRSDRRDGDPNIVKVDVSP